MAVANEKTSPMREARVERACPGNISNRARLSTGESQQSVAYAVDRDDFEKHVVTVSYKIHNKHISKDVRRVLDARD